MATHGKSLSKEIAPSIDVVIVDWFEGLQKQYAHIPAWSALDKLEKQTESKKSKIEKDPSVQRAVLAEHVVTAADLDKAGFQVGVVVQLEKFHEKIHFIITSINDREVRVDVHKCDDDTLRKGAETKKSLTTLEFKNTAKVFKESVDLAFVFSVCVQMVWWGYLVGVVKSPSPELVCASISIRLSCSFHFTCIRVGRWVTPTIRCVGYQTHTWCSMGSSACNTRLQNLR